MGSQFFTAVGAFVGTFLGIWIAETSGTGTSEGLKIGEGFFGTSVGGGELVIPMTAGGESSGALPHPLACLPTTMLEGISHMLADNVLILHQVSCISLASA